MFDVAILDDTHNATVKVYKIVTPPQATPPFVGVLCPSLSLLNS